MVHGDMLHHFPTNNEVLEQCQPVYEEIAGWDQPTASVTSLDRLPQNARRYIDRLEELIGVPIDLISTGPKREAPERSTSTWPELAMSGARRMYDARNLAVPRTPVLEYASGPPKIEIDGKGCTIKLGAQKGGQA